MTSVSAPALSVRVEDKSYAGRSVLGDIRFEMAPGETLAILGPSGIGKTTLLRLIAGLDNRFAGSIQRPDRIAMVFQEPALLPWRSALDNILIATGATEAEARQRLADVGLNDRETDYPVKFSLGQQRRLALARALAARPGLLVLDEPYASLDEQTADQMIALTAELVKAAKVTTLLVTHARREAMRLADRMVTLDGAPARLADIS